MMNKDRLIRLQEIAKSKNKQLLIESVDFSSNNQYNLLENLQINKDEFPILLEDTKGGSRIKARGILKNVPVTRFTENKNGRIYSKRLWESVQNKNSFEGGSCLADHAEKEGSTTRMCGTWHNFRVLENYAVADLYLIGEYGQLFLEAVLSKNKNLGLSTVGFGDFLHDGKSVNPETYELSEESVCDWVLTPSQGVFATYENYTESENMNENSNRKIYTTNQIEKNSNTNKKDIKENFNMDNEFIKLQEYNVKSHIKSALKESKKIIESNDVDAIKENKETLLSLIESIPSSFVSERNTISEHIGLSESTIIDLAKNRNKILQETSTSLQESSTKNAKLLQEKALYEKKISEAKVVVEKLREHIQKEETQFHNSLGLAKKDISLLEKEVAKRDESLKLYETSYSNMKHDIKVFSFREKEILSKLTKYSLALKKIRESVSKVKNTDSKKVKELAKYLEEAKQLVKVYKNKAIESSAKLVETQKKYIDVVKEKNEIKESVSKNNVANNVAKKKIAILETENSKLKRIIKNLKEAHSDFEKKQGYEDYAGKLEDGFLAPEPSQELTYELDKNKNNRYLEVTESIKRLYEKKVRQYPSIKAIQSKILRASSVSQAVEMIEYYLSNSTLKNPIKESVNMPSNERYYPAGGFLKDRD